MVAFSVLSFGVLFLYDGGLFYGAVFFGCWYWVDGWGFYNLLGVVLRGSFRFGLFLGDYFYCLLFFVLCIPKWVCLIEQCG